MVVKVDTEEDQPQQQIDVNDLFEEIVLQKLRFQQISERKNWQGIDVKHAGIPGTTTLNLKEGTAMFQEERDDAEA